MSAMEENSWPAARFEENRKHLHSVAYRILGSLSDADDAVQEAWLRLGRSDATGIDNLAGWLTTVVARVSLDMLRARRARPEEAVGAHIPDPIIHSDRAASAPPEQAAILADSISLALLVVLETLGPTERLAFVLHDMFDVPFDQIASIVGKTPAAARQMVSRARRRVQGAATPPDADLGAQREVVTAFLAAARGGDFDALVRLLDPEVVGRSDLGATARVLRGAEAVARGAIIGSQLSAAAQVVIVNGAPGVVAFNDDGTPRSVVAFTVRKGKITEINVLADPDRLRQLVPSAG
jgi:RNA polymerase sigma-70 factor (ECF subfamily)